MRGKLIRAYYHRFSLFVVVHDYFRFMNNAQVAAQRDFDPFYPFYDSLVERAYRVHSYLYEKCEGRKRKMQSKMADKCTTNLLKSAQ